MHKATLNLRIASGPPFYQKGKGDALLTRDVMVPGWPPVGAMIDGYAIGLVNYDSTAQTFAIDLDALRPAQLDCESVAEAVERLREDGWRKA